MRHPSHSSLSISGYALVVLSVWLTGPSYSVSQQKPDAEVDTFREIARFNYGRATIKGMGSKKWTSGATLATLPVDGQGLSRFVLSMALDRYGLDAGSIRIVMRDKNDNVLSNEKQFAASGAGTENRVLTFVCAFRHRHEDIKALVIEERIQR